MPKRVYKKRVYKRKAKRVSKFGKPTGFSPKSNNYAKITTGNTALDLVSNTPYRVAWKLADFSRAMALTKVYQYYRITAIKMTFKPYFNSFQQSSPVGSTDVPQFYSVLNKSGDAPITFSLNNLKRQGAVPKPFTRTFSRTVSPHTLLINQAGIGGTQAGMGASSKKWISTTDTNIVYYGMLFYIDTGVNTTQPMGMLDYSLVVEYDKPWDTWATTEEGGQSVVDVVVIEGNGGAGLNE